MQALLDGRPLDPKLVSLDPIAFDRGGPGTRALTLRLDADEVLGVGAALRRYVEEAEADEPGFFDDESMEGVPVPATAEVLREDPRFFERYFAEPFWAAETVNAILDAAGTPPHPAPRACSIVRFVRVSRAAEDGSVELEFEAV
jgi:hypothetical protein